MIIRTINENVLLYFIENGAEGRLAFSKGDYL